MNDAELNSNSENEGHNMPTSMPTSTPKRKRGRPKKGDSPTPNFPAENDSFEEGYRLLTIKIADELYELLDQKAKKRFREIEHFCLEILADNVLDDQESKD